MLINAGTRLAAAGKTAQVAAAGAADIIAAPTAPFTSLTLVKLGVIVETADVASTYSVREKPGGTVIFGPVNAGVVGVDQILDGDADVEGWQLADSQGVEVIVTGGAAKVRGVAQGYYRRPN